MRHALDREAGDRTSIFSVRVDRLGGLFLAAFLTVRDDRGGPHRRLSLWFDSTFATQTEADSVKVGHIYSAVAFHLDQTNSR